MDGSDVSNGCPRNASWMSSKFWLGQVLGGCDQRLTARMIGVKKKLVKGNQRLAARRNEEESAVNRSGGRGRRREHPTRHDGEEVGVPLAKVGGCGSRNAPTWVPGSGVQRADGTPTK